MIGRNDPCPCGSGKKYKKCHGNTANTDIIQLVNAELNRIERKFIQEVNPAANYKLTQSYQQLRTELSSVFPDFLINAINIEANVYIAEPEHWHTFITEQSETTMRQQVQDIISHWANPRYLLAHVESTDDTSITLKDEVSGELFTIHNTEGSVPGEWLFGIAMPDSRLGDHGMIVKSSSLFIPKADVKVKDALLAKLQAGVTDTFELYKEFSLANHDSAIVVEDAPTVEVASTTDEQMVAVAMQDEASTFEDLVIELTAKYIKEYNLEASTFTTKLAAFLAEETVKAKKPETVAASAILAGQATATIPEGGLSKVKDVAEYYEVSSSTLAKYRKQITEYLEK